MQLSLDVLDRTYPHQVVDCLLPGLGGAEAVAEESVADPDSPSPTTASTQDTAEALALDPADAAPSAVPHPDAAAPGPSRRTSRSSRASLDLHGGAEAGPSAGGPQDSPPGRPRRSIEAAFGLDEHPTGRAQRSIEAGVGWFGRPRMHNPNQGFQPQTGASAAPANADRPGGWRALLQSPMTLHSAVRELECALPTLRAASCSSSPSPLACPGCPGCSALHRLQRAVRAAADGEPMASHPSRHFDTVLPSCAHITCSKRHVSAIFVCMRTASHFVRGCQWPEGLCREQAWMDMRFADARLEARFVRWQAPVLARADRIHAALLALLLLVVLVLAAALGFACRRGVVALLAGVEDLGHAQGFVYDSPPGIQHSGVPPGILPTWQVACHGSCARTAVTVVCPDTHTL